MLRPVSDIGRSVAEELTAVRLRDCRMSGSRNRQTAARKNMNTRLSIPDILRKILRIRDLGSRTRAAILVLVATSLALGGCGGLDRFTAGTDLLGTERASDPMAAAEAYLRQYQPGPLPRLFQTTRIYDRKGRLLAETFGEGRRIWVGLDDVSPHLIDATVAVEDATFFSNPGVDARRIAGAAIQNLQEGEVVSGASTITMQLARNLFLGPEQRYDQSVDRKVLEAGLAQELTALYSKAEILEMYLNLLNYGQLAYGPEAAAHVYFGKPATDLSLAEASMLAGIPQQPANLNPYDDFDAAKARQRIVLDLMVRHGYLTEPEADAVYAEPVELAGDKGLAPNLAPHFVQYVIDQLDAELGDGYTRRAGFQLETTLDLDMQEIAQRTVRETVAALRPQFDLTNAALVALQPGTADVLAMVGSADFEDDAIAGQVNVAVSLRQPGSAIKPILYAAAIENNLVSPASVLWDVPVTYTVALPQSAGGLQSLTGDALVYRPRNYDDVFHGPVTVRTALANSYNVPTVKLLAGLGVDEMLEFARKMGIRSLQESSDWYGLSLTLGGGEVTLLDLTTAYHTMANAGEYLEPRHLVAMRDSQGRLLEEQPVGEPAAMLSPETAFLVTDILRDNAARTPAFGENSPLRISRPAAVKTGTTTDYRDNWTVGYTRYLVAGVWAGNSDGHPMRNASGVTGAAPIWHNFMEAVLAQPELLETIGAPSESDDWQFERPADLTRLADCPPGVVCRDGGELVHGDWLDEAGEAGPLADSIVKAPAARVLVQQGDDVRLAGFCELEGAAERIMLRLPGVYGLPQDDEETSEGRTAVGGRSVADAGPQEDSASWTLDQLHALAWSLNNGAAADLGPCDRLAEVVTSALALDGQTEAEMRVLVDVAGAGNAEGSALNVDGAVELAVIQQAVGIDGWAGPGTYRLAEPIINDFNCPGQYVMGQVVNFEGAPVAGVRIVMRDPWGNHAEAVSKNGSDDFGRFDFPIYADGAQVLSLTVIDDAGNPLSAPITVPHRSDPGSDTPCHFVKLLGG